MKCNGLSTDSYRIIQRSFLITFCAIACCSFKEDNTGGKKSKDHPDTTIVFTRPQLPKSISFAGEEVPLDRWDVRDQLDRELLLIHGQHATMFYVIKLAGRWFPLIEERLKANGIPDDFKYLCIAESNLQNLISKAFAVGFWQFMSKTAPEYRLVINGEVDERYNVLKSTEAACAYFKGAYARFGSWTAAAASYNCGQGAYSAQAAFQRTSFFYDLSLAEETNKYIFRILSFKHLMENRERYGYALDTSETYQPYKVKSIRVTSSIPDLAGFAISNGTNYKILRILNPWIRGRRLTVRPGKEYTILLPE